MINKKVSHFIGNIFSSMTVNASRIIITFLLTLILPRFLGEVDYSYWQLYLFYFTYLAYTSLGWCEGTYLKYGGKEYDELPAKKMAGQFWTLAIYELIVNILFSAVVLVFVKDDIKVQLLTLAALSAFLDILRYYIQMVLQATNKIREYAKIAASERLLFFAFSLLFLLLHKWEFVYFIYAELLARALSLLLALRTGRGLLFIRPDSIRGIVTESRELIGCGYKLLVAGVAGQLIVGFVRFSIENCWGNLVFGKVSLALSMVNMIITFIAAVSVVIFPMLKRMPQDKMLKMYGMLRELLSTFLLCVLLFYVPMKMVLQIWLPQYEESFRYLAVLLPICIFETRYMVLLGTYFKALRKEQLQLKGNLLSVLLSVVLTLAVVYGIGSLKLAIILIVILLAFKAHFAEYMLKKYVEYNALKDTVWETVLIVGFMLTNWFLDGLLAIGIYTVMLLGYLVFRRKKIKKCLLDMRRMIQ